MANLDREAASAAGRSQAAPSRLRMGAWGRGALRFAATLVVAAAAAALGWFAWRAYMATPWTRDGTVRAYVVAIAPDVAGQIVELPVGDNQFVHKGDLIMQIDPSSYAIAVDQGEARVAQAKASAGNAAAEAKRREELNNLAVTVEEQQTYESQSASATAAYQLELASLANARLNLKRTKIVSPVNGYVTNLIARAGDYANVGVRQVSVIDADSFWVDGYFEETFLNAIHDGDAARVKLMGYPQVFRGHIQSLARGISVANAAPSSATGLATVNPIFTFVRLAQRVPVRIKLEDVPSDVRLVVGTTATVEIVGGASDAAASAR